MPKNDLNLPEELSPKDVLKIVLTILHAHYARETHLLNDILEGFDQLHEEKLARSWKELKEKCQTEEGSLRYFTQWIESQLDGGEIKFPEHIAPGPL